MKKLFANVLCLFVPVRKWRRAIRRKILQDNRPVTDNIPPPTLQLWSQFGEDSVAEVCLGYIFERVHPFNYVEIGSNDPVTANNTYYFYNRGGNGVLVDPNPD
ncbi:MAG: hypothetical protein FWG18_03995, partial [Alphaproteobacteria bacterium]|nr:hypothetical protein [Alphaproteobacteria bacterium]